MKNNYKTKWQIMPKARFLLMLILVGICSTITLQAQTTIEVHGTVVDADLIPIPGVLVLVDGSTTKYTTTDLDGNYSLKGVDENAMLIFKLLGYVQQTLPATKDILDVTMVTDDVAIEEVVIVGFGSQKKENLTGAVGVVGEEVFSSRPVATAAQALQGAIPGLNISSSSGALGQSASISIRGEGTIGEGSTSSPLVLIDGMEGDINTINPQDILTVSVLKDAASSSIYGSRAPFGVILITTRKGKSGKMSVNYNNSFRFATQTNLPEPMDSYSLAMFHNAMISNSNGEPFFTTDYVDRIVAFQNDPTLPTTVPEDMKWTPSLQGANANNNWVDMVYKDMSFGQEHNISMSGGTEKQQIYASINYLDQEGFSYYAPDSYKRIAANLRSTGDLSDWLRYNFNIKYMNNVVTESLLMDDFDPSQSFTAAVVPLYSPDGYLMENWANYISNGGSKVNESHRLYQQAQLVATPLEGWNITAEFNYKYKQARNHTDAQIAYEHLLDGSPSALPQTPTSYVEETSVSTSYLNANVFSDYSFDINDSHNFKIMAGFQSEYSKINDFSALRNGVMIEGGSTIDLTDGTNGGTAISPAVSGKIEEWATAGFFGRFNYDYNGRYLAEINLRYDGTSRFQEDKRWAAFPSFSIGWNVARENFWLDSNIASVISTLKLRASYGELGNQNTTSLYPTYEQMLLGSSDGSWIYGGSMPNTATQPDLISSTLTWETIKTLNVGLDFAAFNNRLRGSFDWFNRQTSSMVGPAPTLPGIFGIDEPKINNTDLVNRGWELSVSWTDRVLNNELGYSVGFMLSDSETIILSYPNEKGLLDFSTNNMGTYLKGGVSGTYVSGQKMGEIWGYTTIGIARSDEEMAAHLATLTNGGQTAIPDGGDADEWKAGDIMYQDINGDGKISSGSNTIYDSGDLSIIGNTTPRYTYAINLSIDYKGFDLSAFIQGVGQRDFAMNSTYLFGGTESEWKSAYFVEHLDYFRTDSDPLGANLDSYYPRPTLGKKNAQIQTAYLLDASYMRLKNIQIGYTFKSEWLSKISLSNLRVFISAENLLTLTSLPDTFDPETISGVNYGINYPMQKTVSVGLNVTF